MRRIGQLIDGTFLEPFSEGFERPSRWWLLLILPVWLIACGVLLGFLALLVTEWSGFFVSVATTTAGRVLGACIGGAALLGYWLSHS
jgi:hypothetical protein